MPVYRVTFGFDGEGQGWSETHAYKTIATLPGDFAITAKIVAGKRVGFLGREFRINSIRISSYSDDTATNRTRGVFLIKQEFTNPVRNATAAAEPAAVALLARGTTSVQLAPPGFGANTNTTFCGAPPDDAVSNAGNVDGGKSGLDAAFKTWALELTNGWGWLASARIADLEIATIAQNANGTVTLTTVGDFPGGITIGQIYTARARRINAGVSPLNGQLILRATAAKTLVTQEVIGLGLEQAGGFVRLYKQVQPFLAYRSIDYELIVGKHKRGRPFGFSPGRARRRVRG
jgi:hypothetical protein